MAKADSSSSAALLGETRRSWNRATRLHNAHKQDQGGFLRAGGSTLFPEEQALMAKLVGSLAGKRLLHPLCNTGADTLSWVHQGAEVTGVDLADGAIAFAQALSAESGLPGSFIHSEVQEYLWADDGETFDVVFCSYGCLGWIEDLGRFFGGCARRLRPRGAFVCVEFHPLVWSFGENFALQDPYFHEGRRYSAPVGDYVGDAGGALSPSGHVAAIDDVVATLADAEVAAHSYQHTVGDIVTAMLGAGLSLEALEEWPWANGCRVIPSLVPGPHSRFVMPPDQPSLPLMVGLGARALG